MSFNTNIALKVCGMRSPENIKALTELVPEYIGFIFYEKSKRYVGEKFNVSSVKEIPAPIKKVGVFVNASLEKVIDKYRRYQLDLVQLHGDESVDYCTQLKHQGISIMKVFSVGSSFDFSKTIPYGECADFFLFDTKGKERGGNGISFDWAVLNGYAMDIPFFLSGGIGLSSLPDLKLFSHPQWVGVDVNSGFELEPGLKDIGALRDFKRSYRKGIKQ